MQSSLRKLVKFIRTLARTLRYGHRPSVQAIARHTTPKWARASMRSENRFKRAMGRTQLPILKKWKLERYVKLNGHFDALVEAVTRIEETSSLLRWTNAFYRRGKESFLKRLKMRRLIRKNRNLIRHTIEY